MSDVLERTDEQTITVDTTNGDHDKFKHYFFKDEIDANFLYGTPMKAVCGKVVVQQSDPQGKPVCGTCKEIYDKAP